MPRRCLASNNFITFNHHLPVALPVVELTVVVAHDVVGPPVHGYPCDRHRVTRELVRSTPGYFTSRQRWWKFTSDDRILDLVSQSKSYNASVCERL
jgi:hypothetical protein